MSRGTRRRYCLCLSCSVESLVFRWQRRRLVSTFQPVRRAAAASRRGLLAIGVIGIVIGTKANAVSAGPPLIADDPNTIGAGNAQPIIATSVLNRRNQTVVAGPILDLTVGAVDSLDVTLVVSLDSLHRETASPAWRWLGVITPGIKWEFLRRDRGSLCISPAFSVGTRDPGRPLVLLPLQGEIEVGEIDATLGFDAGYVSVWRGPGEWFAAVYGQVAVTKRLTFQGEIWSFGATTGHATDLGLSLGTTYLIFKHERKTLELLAAVGPGLASFGESRLDLRAYLGFQYTFARPRRSAETQAAAAWRP